MRGSGRNHIPKDRFRAQPQLDPSELQKSVEELEKQLYEKDLCLARNAERLKRNYGLEVTLDERRSRSRSPVNRRPISPVRNGSRDVRQNRNDRNGRRMHNPSSPIRIDSPQFYEDNTNHMIHRPNRPDNSFEYQGPTYIFEPPQGTNSTRDRPVFEQPPSYHNFDSYQHLHYHDDIDVRVDEMPKWPMEGSPSRDPHPMQRPSYSPSPYWRNQEDVRIEPMPVFPMNGVVDEQSRARKSAKSSSQTKHSTKESKDVRRTTKPSKKEPTQTRQERARMQMRMIAEQAELNDRRAREADRERLEKERLERDRLEEERLKREMEERRKEREKEEEVMETVRKLREQAKKDLKKDETEKRRIEREQRHAQQRKEDEKRRKEPSRTRDQPRSPPRSSARKKRASSSSKTDQADSDETFLDLLRPAFGKFSCETVRVESTRDGVCDYKTTCHVVNIPKEFLKGSHSSRSRDDAHKGAVSDYVKKLVALGVFEDKFRKLMAQSSKFRRFLALFVEPLCNDIAIYGTQISDRSVTNASDKKKQFVNFTKEKCSEFWNNPDNCEKLSNFMQTNVLGVTPSSSSKKSSSSGERKVERSSQKSSTDRRRSPSSDSSIEVVYSTQDNRLSSGDVPILQQAQLPTSSSVTVSNNGLPGGLPSLMSLPVLPPVDVTSLYSQSTTQESYPHQMVPGFQQFTPSNQHYQHPQVLGFDMRQSGGYDDAELMDEIFS